MNENENACSTSSFMKSENDRKCAQPSKDVYLRLKKNESEDMAPCCTHINSTTFSIEDTRHMKRTFHFTKVFDMNSFEWDIFGDCVKRKLIDFAHGKSSTIITYGTEGSGKTYTMYGIVLQPGIIPYAMKFLFLFLEPDLTPCYKVMDNDAIVALGVENQTLERQKSCEFSIMRSINKHADSDYYYAIAGPDVLESKDLRYCDGKFRSSMWISIAGIYNDNIYDILRDDNQPLKLSTRKDGSNYVKGLKFMNVCYPRETIKVVMRLVLRMKDKYCAANKIFIPNSHIFFTIKLLRYQTENAPDTVQLSTLTFCDLASVHSSIDSSSTEMKHIAKSLFVLNKCIKAGRVGGGQGVRPFRESKLTKLLQQVLLDQQAVTYIVTADISPMHRAKTVNVLKNLSNVMTPKLGSAKNLEQTSSIQSKDDAKDDDNYEIVDISDDVAMNHEKSQEDNSKPKDDLDSDTMWTVITGNEDDEDVTINISDLSQPQDTSIDPGQMENANSKLKEYFEILKCDRLSQEFGVRKEFADEFSIAIQKLNDYWKQQTEDVKCDLLKSLLVLKSY